MKLIIPIAGNASRLQPFSKNTPKVLLPTADKIILDHIFDQYEQHGVHLDEIVFITGTMEEQVHEFMDNNHPEYKVHYVQQDKPLGDGHALSCARNLGLEGEVMVGYSDTIVLDPDFSKIRDPSVDAIIWAEHTFTPDKYGILREADGQVVGFEEKPKGLKEGLAAIGMYYFKDARMLFDYLDFASKRGVNSLTGEYHLADTFMPMIQDRRRVLSAKVRKWLDTGNRPNILYTNEQLLEIYSLLSGTNTYLGEEAVLDGTETNYGSIGDGAILKGSEVNNCIMREDVTLENVVIDNSLVGKGAEIIAGKNSRPKISGVIIQDGARLKL